jgi:methionyl aminopeptidase
LDPKTKGAKRDCIHDTKFMKTREQLHALAILGKAHVDLLVLAYEWWLGGSSEVEMDSYIREWCKNNSLRPAFLSYQDYPASYCAQKDDVVIHGIPSKSIGINSRLWGCDIGLSDGEWVLDAAWTACGKWATGEDRDLCESSFKALMAMIKACKAGVKTGTLGSVCASNSIPYRTCQGWYGHGVGRKLHLPPDIPQHGLSGGGETVLEGSLLALEPIVSAGDGSTIVSGDRWTVRTGDRAMSAHQETVVHVEADGARVIVPWWERLPLRKLLAEK